MMVKPLRNEVVKPERNRVVNLNRNQVVKPTEISTTLDVLQTIDSLTKAGVVLKVDNLGLESLVNGKENPTFKLIVSVLANISEMERATIRERQLEGIAEAKKRGVYKGREKGTTETPEQVLNNYKEVVRFIKMKKSLRDTASRCNVSLGTVQKVKKLMDAV